MLEVTSAVNPLAPDTEKDSPEYGLKLLKASVTKWTTGYSGESRLQRKARFDYNRSYALGKYSMQEFKDILDLDGQKSVINLPFDPLSILKPYLNRLKDRYNQRDEIIEITSIDPFTQGQKKEAHDAAIFKLKHTQDIKDLHENSGVQTEEFSENDPKSESDITMEFGFSRRERAETIMTGVVDIVFYENDFLGVKKDKILDELINCGYAGTKVYIDGTGRIKIRVIKPENLITSYSEENDFRDWQYIGEICYKSIMEVQLQYPDKLSDAKVYEMSQNLIGKWGNPTTAPNTQYNGQALARPYDSWIVPVVEMDFKTLYNLKKSVITDKFGKDKVVNDSDVTNPEANVKPLASNPYYVQYTGVYIMDTEVMLEWGLSKNMVKPEKNLQEIISQYSIYMYDNTEMTNKSLTEQLIPFVKEMQLYKLQQLKIVAAAAPDGYDIDIATMSDISLDGGTTMMSPLDLYSIYKQTGNKYYKSIPDEGIDGGSRRVPIQANNVPFSAKLEQLSNLYNQALMSITNLVSNELDNGNVRNQAVGNGVMEEAKKTGESTSNYLYNSFLNIMKRTAIVTQLRGWDILMYGKKFGIQSYDGYRQALGTSKIEYIKLEATDDWGKTAFDTQIKTIIGDTAEAYLENNIQQSLTQKEITFADAIDIRMFAETNVRYASYVMAQRIANREKLQQENAMQLSKQNENATVAAATAKTNGELQVEQQRAQNDAAKDLRQRETAMLSEQEKMTSILKVEIAKAILADPNKSMKDIPSFVFEGLPLAKAMDHANAMNYLQTMAQAQAAQQQEAQAQQQQQGQPQQGQPNPQQQSPPQQQAA